LDLQEIEFSQQAVGQLDIHLENLQNIGSQLGNQLLDIERKICF
jgi:hypothetical protein